MHILARQVRFAVNPFSDSTEYGANSYCAKPTADGLALFFALWVELKGKANADTGFVVNVSDIDKIVRDKTVEIFSKFLKNRSSSSFEQIGQLLSRVWQKIENEFLPVLRLSSAQAKINSLTVELMPARKVGIKERDGNMLFYSEKFEFSASHTLWNKKLSDEENEKVFGKCANRTGHGHNYIIEVTVKKGLAPPSQWRGSEPGAKATGESVLNAGDFERIIEKEFIRLVDHKNLNTDVGYFKKTNPTVENIAEFAFRSLSDKLKPMELDCITVWENDRTFCSFRAK